MKEESKYQKEAKKFLSDTGTTIDIQISQTQDRPDWCSKTDQHGIQYKITLANARHTYTFDFWNSIHNRAIIEAIENIKYTSKQKKDEYKQKYQPNEYNIIACLSPMYESNFVDWCGYYGYDTDSIKASKIYENCIKQDWNLRKLFDFEQLQALGEIQ